MVGIWVLLMVVLFVYEPIVLRRAFGRWSTDLLKADSVASGALPGLRELNIPPKAVEEVVPTYISRSLSGV